MSIPSNLGAFECYDEGDRMIGVADIVLPNFSYVTETVQGAGVGGEIEMPTVGLFQSMTTTINWRLLTDTNARFIGSRVYHFDFRGTKTFANNTVGRVEQQMLKIVMRAIPKTFTAGNLQQGSAMGTSGEFEVLYIQITLNNNLVTEVDKINYKCIIDGIDYLDITKQHLGL